MKRNKIILTELEKKQLKNWKDALRYNLENHRYAIKPEKIAELSALITRASSQTEEDIKATIRTVAISLGYTKSVILSENGNIKDKCIIHFQ